MSRFPDDIEKDWQMAYIAIARAAAKVSDAEIGDFSLNYVNGGFASGIGWALSYQTGKSGKSCAQAVLDNIEYNGKTPIWLLW
jgi:hypothetical protein